MNLFDKLYSARGKTIVVGGHRGHQSVTRENTIANFEEILDLDLPYVEIDVQLTKDGVAVIYHDHDLSLKTQLHGMIRDYTLLELRRSFEINTVDEVLAWCKAHGMGIAFELKLQPISMWEDRMPIADALVDAIERYDYFDMCFVFGKDYGVLSEIKSRNPKIQIALIVPFVPKNAVALMKEMDAIIYLNFVDQLSKALVEELHAAGILVDGSVVNSEKDLEKAMALGVDMIESDYPERILNAMKRIDP